MATSASGSAETAWDEVAAKEALLAGAAQQDAKGAYLAHVSDDARVMGSPAQPAVGRQAIGGDLVFTYGDAHWTRDGEERRGHYVRVWQKRRQGWVLVFDELLGGAPRKPAP